MKRQRWHLFVPACLASALAFAPRAIFAQQAMPTARPDSTAVFAPVPANTPVDMFSFFLETVAIVAALTLVLYFGLRWYRSAVYGRTAARQTTRITLLASSAIAPKKSVSVVRVLDHLLVLGLSDDNMNVLLDVPVDELSDELKQSLSAGQSVPGASFKSLLDNWKKN